MPSQPPLAPETADARALALEAELDALSDAAAQAHATLLRKALALHRVDTELGRGAFTDVNLALLLRTTERRAEQLLRTATTVGALAVGFAVLDTWTAEQLDAVLAELDGLPPELMDTAIDTLLARGRQQGVRGLRRAAAKERQRLAAQDAAERRKKATAQRGISHQVLPDGQAGLWIQGPAVDITRILAAVKAASAPDGPHDTRTADNRRFDALLSLVIGGTSDTADSRDAAAPVIHVLTPLATLLDQSDEPALLLGSSTPGDRGGSSNLSTPLDAAHVRELARHPGTVLHSIPVDPVTGQPLAGPGPAVQPIDDLNLRQLLLDMLHAPPPQGPAPPVWPGGHQQAHHPPDQPPDEHTDDPPDDPPDDPRDRLPAPRPGAEPCPDISHPGGPGAYRIPEWMKALLDARSPHCEFPDCTLPAARCDHDHDLAWPAGATCPCNLGPLCRHHHRVKQTGWTKTRHADGSITWTSPTGRNYPLPAQQEPPPTITRPLPLLADDEQLLDEPDWRLDDPPDLEQWFQTLTARACDPTADLDPEDPDPDHAAHRAHDSWQDPWHDSTWGPHLDDPAALAAPVDPGQGPDPDDYELA